MTPRERAIRIGHKAIAEMVDAARASAPRQVVICSPPGDWPPTKE